MKYSQSLLLLLVLLFGWMNRGIRSFSRDARPAGKLVMTTNNNHDGDSSSSTTITSTSRRQWLQRTATQLVVASSSSAANVVVVGPIVLFPKSATAYDADPDPLRESLYLLARVQEATCLQERYMDKARPPLRKMKLTLRLVDKSYRLQDQVNVVSKYVPDDVLVAAVQAGNQAVASLQDAIDFVNRYADKDKQPASDDESTSAASPMTQDQRVLSTALTDTREQIFNLVEYIPADSDAGRKVAEARTRVEEENKLNRDEFDPDLVNDQGVFNPVELPWKNRRVVAVSDE